MELNHLRYALQGVSTYKHLLEQPLMGRVMALLDGLSCGDGEGALAAYTGLYYDLCNSESQSMGQWLCDQLRYTESPYAHHVEVGGENPALVATARRDIETFQALAQLDCHKVLAQMKAISPQECQSIIDGLPQWSCSAPFDFDGLTTFYQANGAGIFAKHRAFLWEDGVLHPVPDPDAQKPHEMLGYQLQRNQVIANTKGLLEGHLVNNVLLYGDSGTGKSATVKALLTLEGFENLRLIEVQKDELMELPQLIRALKGRRRKFILFVDDLAFDQDDKTYSVLKTILEGGLERRPDNVAIYATSNRRNLVRQTFSDRAGDEVDASETIAEKTSLSDRFGLRIPYLNLNKAEFLTLVEGMAELSGIQMEQQELRAKAVMWEMHRPGRTPRTAKQFIASLKL